jgi:hypothetical protein
MNEWSGSHRLNPRREKLKSRRPGPYSVLFPVGFAAEQSTNFTKTEKNSVQLTTIAG